jgi:hypothetical protein
MRSFIALCLVFTAAALVAQEPKVSDAETLYQRGLVSLAGTGPSQDVLGGLRLIKQSANLGYKPAQMAEGYIQETGLYGPSNPTEASNWYRKVAEQGDDTAAWLLARMYFAGAIPGTPQDAQKWARASADAGNPFGAYLLALSLLQRDDPKGAVPFFKAAATKGLPYAQLQYAQALTDARGAPVNKHEACVWYLIAYDAGLNEAQPPLQALEADLGSTETAQVKSETLEIGPKVLRQANAGSCTGWPGELDRIPTTPPLLSAACRSL